MVGLQSGGWNPVVHGKTNIHGADTPLHYLVHENFYIGGTALKGGLVEAW